MDKLITRFETERLDDQTLESRFADLQAILLRTQREQGERLQALASVETLEAERNRPPGAAAGPDAVTSKGRALPGSPS